MLFSTQTRRRTKRIREILDSLVGPVASYRIFAFLSIMLAPKFTFSDKCSIFRYTWHTTALLNNKNFLKKIEQLKKHSKIKKKFYPITVQAPQNGLYALVAKYMYHVSYAVSRGYIPVIDMQTYPTPYIELDKIGKENAWEYYFEQPCQCGLNDMDDIVLSKWEKKIIDNNATYKIYGSYGDYKPAFDFYSTLYRNFLIPNKTTREYIDREYQRIIKAGMKVLGVSCRGSDYTLMKPYAHPIQPEVKDVIEKVSACMRDWHCSHIYVATEERAILQQFVDTFPGKVLSVSQAYVDDVEYKDLISSGLWTPDIRFDRDNDTYIRGLEYLASIEILSRCDCLVTSLASGRLAALYLGGDRFEHKYVFDLGYYGAEVAAESLQP